MNRYIDADKFAERIKASPAFSNMGQDGYFLQEVVLEILDKFPKVTPTADVVEVVRCKDCIYCNSNSNCCFNRQWDLVSSSEVPFVTENDFCSFGERREENNV